MENSEHVFLRNVDPGLPGLLVANLLRPLQLAPNASMSLSSLNVSMTRGITVEDGEFVGAAYGEVAGALTRYQLFAQPTLGTYVTAKFAKLMETTLNNTAIVFNGTDWIETNDLNKNGNLTGNLWRVNQSAGNTSSFDVTCSVGFTGELVPTIGFGSLENCAATAAGVLTAAGAGAMAAYVDTYVLPTGAHWMTLPNNLDLTGFVPLTETSMRFINTLKEEANVTVIGDNVNDGEYVVSLDIRGVNMFTTTITTSAGNGIIIGLVRERGGIVVAWQDSSVNTPDVTAGILYDTRLASGSTVTADMPGVNWPLTTYMVLSATAQGALSAITDIWATVNPAGPLGNLKIPLALNRAFAPGSLADELGFIDDGISTGDDGDFIDDTYSYDGVTVTIQSQVPSRNDATNNALIVSSDDIPASGRIADLSGSARERALIDFITATSGLSGESTYEQAYPRHCYIKNRDVLSLQQMTIRLLDQDGADASRVRPGGCAMLTFHNVVR